MGPRGAKKYTKDTLDGTVEAVKKGMAFKAAAKVYGVPRSTLQFRCSNKFFKSTHGPSPILSNAEESILVRWIFDCARKGFPRRKEDIQMSVKEFVEQSNRTNPFKDNMPGNKWYNCFLHRHPEISRRTPEGVTAASACVSEENIKGWFRSVEDLLKEEKIFDVLTDPERVFNGDETNFKLCPKKNLVLAPTGSKNVYEVEVSQAKVTLTVMCTFSASGKTCPPMIIYPLKRISQDIIQKVPDNWGIGRSDNGWMKSEVFFEFIGNVFYPYLVQNKVPLPVVLFVDGHKTHLTYHLTELCKELKIILISLYPNSTRILQPADVAAFRPVKNKWKDAVLSWRAENLNKAVTKQDFAPILETLLQNLNLESSLKNGFRATGLYPWNADAVDYSKCIGRNIKITNSEDQPANETNLEKQQLQYTDFCEIVGEKQIEKFKNIKKVIENEQHSEEFFVLFRLWEHYQKKDSNKKQNKCNELVAENMEVIEWDDHENISVCKKTGEKNDEQLISMNKELHPENKQINHEQNATKSILDFEHLPIINDENLANATEEYPAIIPHKNPANVNDENSVTHSCTPPSRTIDGQQLSLGEHLTSTPNKDRSFDQILTWPETPKRKGKRNTERIPFVLTSGKWKEVHNEKEKLKEQTRMEKEDRKNERLRKKKQKEQEQMAKAQNHKKCTATKTIKHPKLVRRSRCKSFIQDQETSSHISKSSTSRLMEEAPESSTDKDVLGMCFKCTNTVVPLKKGYECSMCSNLFHKKCIPKDHQIHIPDDSDDDLFVCHSCFTAKDSSDGDMMFE